MATDLSGKTDAELNSLIANHERVGAWGAPLLLAAVAERSRRQDGGLDLDRTLDLIFDQTRKGRFVTYKDVAAGSKQPWEKVRWKVFSHLGDLCIREFGSRNIIPTCVVVTEPNRLTGVLDGESLAGFERMCAVLRPTDAVRGAALVERERARLREHLGLCLDATSVP